MAHEIRNLIEEFKCPVCLQIMKRDIFRLINCGHSLCTDCYYRSHFRCNSGITEHCPVCRNAISHSGDFGSRFLQHTDKHLESLVNKLYALSDSHNVKENTIYPDYANKLIKNTGQTIFNTILSNYRFLSEKEENCLDELREEIKLSDNEKQQELASTAHTVSEAKIKLFYEFLGDFERIKYNRETSMAKKLSIERTVTVFLKYGKKSIQSKLNIFTKWNNLYAQLVKDNSDIFLIQPKFHEMKINLYHLSVRRKTETDYYKYKDSCLKFTFPEGSQIPFMHLNQG
ncbi:hypothetical protein SNEBB_003466 [Seison nebaliae]|nr:hypothetical protein SNEBB_003466 [Seison nebaliae]